MMAQSIFGFFVFIALAWLLSENRSIVNTRGIIIGIALQVTAALVLLKLPFFQFFFLFLNKLVLALDASTKAGTAFVFGYLADGSLPFGAQETGSTFIMAFQALPLVLVISALSSLLFYWKILPVIVHGFSWCLRKTLKIGGAEGLGVSANVFVGMVEAPLFIRPYLEQMTRSEFFSLMTCGMATIAGTVMVLYASILSDHIPNVMGHILTASIISVPAAITIAKIMVPETGTPTTGEMVLPDPAKNAMDAITKGTVQGVDLLINIIAMLIVLVALVHLINLLLGLLPNMGVAPLTLQNILGLMMAPVVWLMGVPWSEALSAGTLMGTKTVLNEFIAYLEMANLTREQLSSKSTLIMTYALCGFANPGSLGIMIGGLGTMAPGRRSEIVGLGLKSILAGTLATCMTGALAGILL